MLPAARVPAGGYDAAAAAAAASTAARRGPPMERLSEWALQAVERSRACDSCKRGQCDFYHGAFHEFLCRRCALVRRKRRRNHALREPMPRDVRLLVEMLLGAGRPPPPPRADARFRQPHSLFPLAGVDLFAAQAAGCWGSDPRQVAFSHAAPFHAGDGAEAKEQHRRTAQSLFDGRVVPRRDVSLFGTAFVPRGWSCVPGDEVMLHGDGREFVTAAAAAAERRGALEDFSDDDAEEGGGAGMYEDDHDSADDDDDDGSLAGGGAAPLHRAELPSLEHAPRDDDDDDVDCSSVAPSSGQRSASAAASVATAEGDEEAAAVVS
jgi:hypothetical protein